MALQGCQHLQRAQGIMQCELTRNGDGPLYSTAFKASICATCGRTEFYCEPYQEVCAWLETKPPIARGTMRRPPKTRKKAAPQKPK
jgi:glutamyl-tRNA reductase